MSNVSCRNTTAILIDHQKRIRIQVEFTNIMDESFFQLKVRYHLTYLHPIIDISRFQEKKGYFNIWWVKSMQIFNVKMSPFCNRVDKKSLRPAALILADL